MTRGYKPVVAIGEAQRKATAWGFLLITLVTEAKLPFDFVTRYQDRTSLVRIRRLKYSQYRIPDILISCKTEIKELRELRVPEGISLELWVRGPGRSWHRYVVLAEGIEEIGNEDSGQKENDPVENPEIRQQLGAG